MLFFKYFIFFFILFIIFSLPNLNYTFAQNKFILSISKNSADNGKINLNQPNIDCDTGCASVTPPPYNHGASITLVATPVPGYTFKSWSGDCSGNNPTCVLTMNANKNVVANFSPKTDNQTVTSTTTSPLSPPQIINTTRQDRATTADQPPQSQKTNLFVIIIIVGIPLFFVLFALFWFWQSRRYRD